jgi:replicative DNA helicase
MFVIDHLHYLDYWKEEASWLTDIVKAIKETTEIVKKPVILVSHLSRAYMNQKRLPNKWDLHWSSNIEKNANTIILLCPWELNEELEKHPEHKFYRPTKIIVDKNRAGMPVPWIFDTTFDLRTKTYLEWWIYEWLSLDDNNRLTVYDKIF